MMANEKRGISYTAELKVPGWMSEMRSKVNGNVNVLVERHSRIIIPFIDVGETDALNNQFSRKISIKI